MSDSLLSCSDLLAQFDRRSDGFREYEVRMDLGSLRCDLKDRGEDLTSELEAECLAFAFTEDRQSGWESYFSPLYSRKTATGEVDESPSLKELTPLIIAYWIRRAQESKHPVLRIRYSGLVWELAQKVKEAQRPVKLAHILIDSVVELSRLGLGNADFDLIPKLGWALSVAVSLRDTARLATMRDAILAFEDRVAQDQFPGLWGVSFDLLLNNKKIDPKKVEASHEQRQKILADLEARLMRLSGVEDVACLEPHSIEKAALGLGSYYRKIGQHQDTKRVLGVYARAYLRKAAVSYAMVASTWLRHVHETLLCFQLHDEADAVLTCYCDYAKKAMEEMPTHRESISLDSQEVQCYLREMTEGAWDTVFYRLIIRYVPRRENIEKFVREQIGNDPLLRLFPITLVDAAGRATDLGTVEEDPESNIIHYMAEEMRFRVPFLRWVVQELVRSRGLNSTIIINFVYQSRIFDKRKRMILEAGLDAYFTGQWMVAIHFLVPQIEGTVRKLVERSGGNIHKRHNRTDALMLKTLDELLREEIVEHAFTPDGAFYLRVLLTDQRGWNIRNDVCHGVPPVEYFCAGIADRLLHALLLLGAVRASSGLPPESTPDDPQPRNEGAADPP